MIPLTAVRHRLSTDEPATGGRSRACTMPYINTAMERSLQRSVGSYVLDTVLGPRGITDEVNGVKTTFSSWDGCMAKTYCKSVPRPPSIICHCLLMPVADGLSLSRLSLEASSPSLSSGASFAAHAVACPAAAPVSPSSSAAIAVVDAAMDARTDPTNTSTSQARTQTKDTTQTRDINPTRR